MDDIETPRDEYVDFGADEEEFERAAKTDDESDDDADDKGRKHIGFNKLKAKLSGSVKDPGAVAAAIGIKKYGKAGHGEESGGGEEVSEIRDNVGALLDEQIRAAGCFSIVIAGRVNVYFYGCERRVALDLISKLKNGGEQSRLTMLHEFLMKQVTG